MKTIMKDASTKWTEKNLPDLTGKIIVITGANSGTGFAATKFLSAKGATIVMACRNPDKANKALQSIKKDNAEAKLDFIQLDLSSLASIKQFSEESKRKVSPHLNVELLMRLKIFREFTLIVANRGNNGQKSFKI